MKKKKDNIRGIIEENLNPRDYYPLRDKGYRIRDKV
jgi:hypothetical protein